MRPPDVPTASNRSPAIDLAVWICFCCSCLATFTKSAKSAKRRPGFPYISGFHADDYFIFAALIFLTGFSAATSVAASSGLGKPQLQLEPYALLKASKATYVAEVLFILTLAASQLAALLFVETVSRLSIVNWPILITKVAILAWTVASLFTVFFQCSLPQPWMIYSSSCLDQDAFWIATGVASILIEMAIIIIPVYIILRLQTSIDKKAIAVSIFCLRIFNVAMILLRIVYVGQLFDVTDRTLNSWKVVVLAAVNANVAVIVTCGVYFRPILQQIQPGWSSGHIYDGLGFESVTAPPLKQRLQTDPTFPQGSVVRSIALGSRNKTVPSTWAGNAMDNGGGRVIDEENTAAAHASPHVADGSIETFDVQITKHGTAYVS